MPIDPVCGHKVDLRKAHAMKIVGGRALYFCSAACNKIFMENIQDYPAGADDIRLTVGVMGSSVEPRDGAVILKARALGKAIASAEYNLITGACPGLPLLVAKEARAFGGLSIGVSPALSLQEHLYKYDSPVEGFDLLIYTGSGLMGREVTNIRSSDMVVLLGGRSGTLGEFAIAYDEGKLIGVLDGSGGITEHIDDLINSIEKETGSVVIHHEDPEDLIRLLTETYEQTHFRKPSCFC